MNPRSRYRNIIIDSRPKIILQPKYNQTKIVDDEIYNLQIPFSIIILYLNAIISLAKLLRKRVRYYVFFKIWFGINVIKEIYNFICELYFIIAILISLFFQNNQENYRIFYTHI